MGLWGTYRDFAVGAGTVPPSHVVHRYVEGHAAAVRSPGVAGAGRRRRQANLIRLPARAQIV
jgi:hypothetical protein